MVGKWIDKDATDNVDVETDCNWTKNKNFLTRAYKVTIGDHIDMSGMQIVGWDPAAKTIRSWTFDSNGGFAKPFGRTKGMSGSSTTRASWPMAERRRWSM